MEARIIGSSEELGMFETITLFGNQLSREWSEVKVTPEQYQKLQGNRYVELRGEATEAETSEEAALQATQEQNETDQIKARLDELGVSYRSDASPKTLRSKLDQAEKAEAQRLEEEAQAEADAQRDGEEA